MKEHIGVILIKERLDLLVRRIKESEKSTDPTVLRSTKLLDELQKEDLEAKLDACKLGRPSGEGTSGFKVLFKAMGIERYDFPEMVDETLRYAEYKKVLERMGYPEQCCERAIAQIAMSEMGELPKPNIVANVGHSCDIHGFSRQDTAKIFNIPMFYVDIPLNEDDKPNLADLDYVVDQLCEFIEWAEKKVPGVKYDKDRHAEIVKMCAVGEKYLREIYQLVKHAPCPIPPLDEHHKRMFNFDPSRFPNIQKANEYLRICRDEVGERVASGKGPYPEERLRILWAGHPPHKGNLNVGRLLMERKVALPAHVGGHTRTFTGLGWQPSGEVSEYGVVLSPLQETARDISRRDWNGPGKRFVNSTLDIARDLGVHGIIHFQLIGCTPMRSMGSMVADRAEKELGIPTLKIEGRLHDREYMSQERFEEILSAFIDKCFDWAGKPRQ